MEASKNPKIIVPLPDGTFLRAVGFANDAYPSINIYWDNGKEISTEPIGFVEYNPGKPGNQKVCIGAYQSEQDNTAYYEPYVQSESPVES